MDLIADLVDKDPSVYLGHVILQPTIVGYRVWATHGETSQHAILYHYIISPALPAGFTDITVDITVYPMGSDRLQENRGRTRVDIPRIQLTL